MIDIGIDWEARYGSGWIRRFEAAPAFEAGASLLRGAGLLWLGKYGQGRIVGNAANALAGQMWDLGNHWRAAGLRWTATMLSEHGLSKDSAHLLRKFHDRRRYFRDGTLRKHPQAARRLTQAALLMASDRLEIIRDSSSLLGGMHNDADAWEDRFETLGETSLGVPPDPPLSDSERRALERYAIYRACEGLAFTAASVIAARSDRRRDGGADADSQPWYDASGQFAKRAKGAYAEFAGDASHDPTEREPLLSVFDIATPYAEFYERHYSTDAAISGAAAIVAFYVHLLLHAAHDAENPLETMGTFKKAGLKLSTARHPRVLSAADL